MTAEEKLNMYVKSFVSISEDALTKYLKRLEDHIIKSGKFADAFGRAAGLAASGLEGVDDAGYKALSLVSLSIVNGIVAKIGGEHNRNELKKLTPLLFHFNRYPDEVRSVLVAAAAKIFVCYQQQLIDVTADGSWERAMHKLAEDAVDRFFAFCKEDNTRMITINDVTKGVVKGSSKRYRSQLHKGHIVNNNEETWNTSKMYSQVGLVRLDSNYIIIGYFMNHEKCDPEKFSYRLLFPWEENERFEEIPKPNCKKYNFSIERTDTEEHIKRILGDINDNDPNRMEDRMKKTVTGAKEELLLRSDENTQKTIDEIISVKDRMKKTVTGAKEELLLRSDENTQKTIDEIISVKKLIAESKFHKESNRKEQTSVKSSEIWKNLQKALENAKMEERKSFQTPVYFGVKRPVVPFVGRTSQLKNIAQSLGECNKVVLTGLGGIGKSEIARKFIEEHQSEYDGNLIWLNSSTTQNLDDSILNLAKENLRMKELLRPSSTIAEIYKILESEKVLFIFDDAKDYNSIEPYLPPKANNNHKFLITSIKGSWHCSNDTLKPLHIDDFPPADAYSYIKTALANTDKLHDKDVQDLATVMGFLPLALQQATAFIKKMGKEYSIAKYITKYRQSPEKLLDRNYTGETNAKTICRTLQIALEELKNEAFNFQGTANILSVMSYLSPNEIPKEIFLGKIASGVYEELQLMLNPLISYSIVKEEDGMLSIHELSQKACMFNNPSMLSEEDVLDLSLTILSTNNSNKLGNHVRSVWNHAFKYPTLIDRYILKHEELNSSTPNPLFEIMDGEKLTVAEAVLVRIPPDKFIPLISDDLNKGYVFQIRNVSQQLVDLFCKKHLSDNFLSLLLIRAADAGDEKIIKFLISTHGANVFAENTDGLTPLHYAALNGDLGVIDYLVSKMGGKVDPISKKGYSPLHLAALNDHVEAVERFISTHGANVFVENTYGATPLHYAALDGHLRVIDYLVSKMGGMVDPISKEGLTPLHWAAQNGHVEAVERLISTHGANVFVEDTNGYTPLHLAAKNGHLRVIDYLVSKMGGMVDPIAKEGSTPMFCAAQEGHVEAVERLISTHGANVFVEDTYGFTPLYYAARNGHLRVIDYLVSKMGGKVDPISKKGHTPLHGAAQNGHVEAVEHLISTHGANVFVEDTYGCTPLHYAALDGHLRVIDYLVSKMGGKVDPISTKGHTPLHGAAQNDHVEAVERLISTHGANVFVEDTYGCTPLHYAALDGHLRVIDYLVSKMGGKVDPISTKGHTPLHGAAQNDHVEAVDCLISTHGANVFVEDTYGCTPLHYTARNGHLRVIDYLVSKMGRMVDPISKDGSTPMFCAAEEGHVEAVERLISTHGANVFVEDTYGCTPLYYAARNGHLRVIDYLVSKMGGKVDPISKKGHTPLHGAAQNDHVEAVERLISTHGANVFVEDTNGCTPLHYTARNGHLRVIDYLVSKMGRMVDPISKEGLTPLHCAAEEGHVEAVERLISTHGANVFVEDTYGCTPLYYAARNGHLRVIDYLVSKMGGKVDPISKKGHTPLHGAAQNDHVEAVERLISTHGANVFVEDTYGCTPLHYTARNGHLRVIDYLVSKMGRKVDPISKEGLTPLHCAAQNGHVEAVERLISTHGANVFVEDTNGYTPLYLAAQNGHLRVIDYLVSKMGGMVDPVEKKGHTPLHGHAHLIKFILQANADVLARNNHDTVLHKAIIGNNTEIIHLVLEAIKKKAPANVADYVNAPDSEGDTPLMWACQNGKLNAVRELLREAGADCHVNAQNNNGETALHWANRGEYLQVIKLLQDHGADESIVNNNGQTPSEVFGMPYVPQQ